jgi:hypothetical protein
MLGSRRVKLWSADESGCSRVKIRRQKADNFCGRNATRNSERLSLPSSEHPWTVSSIESSRLDLILHRLQQNFYEQAPAADRVAAAVLAELKTLDESSPALPH